MARDFQSTATMLLLTLAACSGETASSDFGEGKPGGSEPPPATQNGESTPTPNFPGCEECSNACFACLQEAGQDETAVFVCIASAACQAYLAQTVDLNPEYTPEGNVLQTPQGEFPGEDECLEATTACEFCLCSGASEEDCAELC